MTTLQKLLAMTITIVLAAGLAYLAGQWLLALAGQASETPPNELDPPHYPRIGPDDMKVVPPPPITIADLEKVYARAAKNGQGYLAGAISLIQAAMLKGELRDLFLYMVAWSVKEPAKADSLYVPRPEDDIDFRWETYRPI